MFADEAGDFEFSRKPNVSRFFILCTVSMHSCHIAQDLLDLRRNLAWDGVELGDYFHCSNDSQAVRNRVFDVIGQHDFTVHATIMEKSKSQPHIRASRPVFYKYGWFYHFKHGVSPHANTHPELLVTTASIGTRKEKRAFSSAVDDVMKQTVAANWQTDFRPSAADPCLQVADYCAWAIQRKWERGDDRSYRLIADRIDYEYDLWARGTTHHY
ncbi:MAG: DUF3800 domain-containing protein [Rhodobacterales bacterium]|nr:DUF3800 domain-containing protein [Rhodobacterales bacterium]